MQIRVSKSKGTPQKNKSTPPKNPKSQGCCAAHIFAKHTHTGIFLVSTQNTQNFLKISILHKILHKISWKSQFYTKCYTKYTKLFKTDQYFKSISRWVFFSENCIFVGPSPVNSIFLTTKIVFLNCIFWQNTVFVTSNIVFFCQITGPVP